MDGILIVTKWVLLLLCSVVGMVLTTTEHQTLGFILAFGCFLIFALDVARNFIEQKGGKNMTNKPQTDPLMNIAKSFNDVSLSASLQGQVLVLMELQVHIQTKINGLEKKIEDTSPLKLTPDMEVKG